MQDKQTRLALIAQGVDGPLEVQRAFQKVRKERPALGLEEVLNHLVEPSLGERGAQALAALNAQHIQVVTLLDKEYPRMLREIADPPLVLFYHGELQCLHRPAVAVVGSRKCSRYGSAVASQLGAELARLGFVVVSGLARGIDTRVHEAALAVEGRTTAVLGSGPDRIYPPENRELARRIVTRRGIVISEFPPGMPIKPFHFPIRNRIISGLCHATLVVEAGEKSGSLITARHCLDQGRELFAVPGQINRAGALGTNGLIATGEARLLRSVEDVLAELQPLLGMAGAHQERVETLIENPEARAVYERLDAFEPTPLDILVADLGISTGAVTGHLMELEIDGLVERLPGANFTRNPIHE